LRIFHGKRNITKNIYEQKHFLASQEMKQCTKSDILTEAHKRKTNFYCRARNKAGNENEINLRDKEQTRRLPLTTIACRSYLHKNAFTK
jgi:hypothetical protein